MIELKEQVDRNQNAIACPKCNGYAERVDLTEEEIAHQICKRTYECCGRAFVCRVCKERIVGNAESPEADFS